MKSSMSRLIFLSLLSILIYWIKGDVYAQNDAENNTLFLPLISKGIGQPTLKFAYGGCYNSWCETGWYSSPAVINIDDDPQAEIIASAYSLWALDGASGQLQWRIDPRHGRTWPGIVIADLQNDGIKEIIIGQGDGWLSSFSLQGSLQWEKRITTSELRGLSVVDVDGNGSALEILVTAAIGSKTSVWLLSSNGEVTNGWPQVVNSDTTGYAYGVFNDNAAVANLVGDAKLEIILPTDVHYIQGFFPNGSPLPANTAEYPNRNVWGKVGVWEDLAVEKRGWGQCKSGYSRSENYRPNFAHSPAAIADLDNNGTKEIVVVGNVYDCSQNPYLSRYYGPFIFHPDRTRFHNGQYDWQSTPVDTGAPLSENYNVIESAMPNPVLADLNGDNLKEILFASYNGKIHAFWLDKNEKGNWPYSVNYPSEGILRFASEPVVADLDNNGYAEVIFTSWTSKNSNKSGKLHILSYSGSPIYEIELPPPKNGNWNGGLPAPTLANIDNDPDIEIVINTAHSGIVVYDLPGSANARILWATGRGNYQRTGVPPIE